MTPYENNLSIYAPAYPQGLRRFGSAAARQAANLLGKMMTWRERARSRQHLASLDDYMLRDIGIDRASAVAESDKAFWNR